MAEYPRSGKSSSALAAVLEDGIDRVTLVRDALKKPGGNNRAAAVALLQEMSDQERQQLFPELMQLARSAHGPIAAVRSVIASLPRDWMLARIDAEVDRIIDDQQYDDYWMFIELLTDLDDQRALKLARRAVESDDPDIRELGTKTLDRLLPHA